MMSATFIILHSLGRELHTADHEIFVRPRKRGKRFQLKREKRRLPTEEERESGQLQQQAPRQRIPRGLRDPQGDTESD